jgi:hypothetical protein
MVPPNSVKTSFFIEPCICCALQKHGSSKQCKNKFLYTALHFKNMVLKTQLQPPVRVLIDVRIG